MNSIHHKVAIGGNRLELGIEGTAPAREQSPGHKSPGLLGRQAKSLLGAISSGQELYGNGMSRLASQKDRLW